MKIAIVFFFLLLALAPAASAAQMNSSNYSSDISLFPGGLTSSGNYSSDISMEISGELSSENYILSAGIFFVFGEPSGEALNLIIISPSNTTYNTSSIDFNISSNNQLSSCILTLNNWLTNYTMSAYNSTYFTYTNTSMPNGQYTARFWCNNTEGNTTTVQVSFTISTGTSATNAKATVPLIGKAPVKKEPDIEFSQENINIKGIVGILDYGTLTITNTGDKEQRIIITLQNITNIVRFRETSFLLSPGETLDLEYEIIPPKEPGIYTGKIIVSVSGAAKEIPFVLNVKSEKGLFDISVDISDESKLITGDEPLIAQITLIQMGLQEKADVTVNYYIKDFSGRQYFTESETVMVFREKSYQKEFKPQLPPGSYVLGVEVIYSGGVATASSQFSVEELATPADLFFGTRTATQTVLIIAMAFAVVLLFALIFMIKAYKRPARKYKTAGQKSAEKK